MPKAILVLAILAVGPLAAGEANTTFVERHITRILASPTSVAPDAASFQVTVPKSTVVSVLATSAGPSSIFILHYRTTNGSADGASPLATARQGATLTGGDSWRIDVDPFAGANVNIDVTFTGHVIDITGAAASFAFADLGFQDACIGFAPPGTCLP